MKTYKGKITELKSNQYFVFGSNPEGRHGKGAAKIAVKKFGAKYGKGKGLHGHSFAIVTKNLTPEYTDSDGIFWRKAGARSVPEELIMDQIALLYIHAMKNPKDEFFIAYTPEPNLNGYSSEDMGRMFRYAIKEIPENIVFNDEFAILMEHITET